MMAVQGIATMRLRIAMMFPIERCISVRAERNEQSDEEKNSNRTEKRSNSRTITGVGMAGTARKRENFCMIVKRSMLKKRTGL